MSKQLSLIILTYNSEKDIYDCLASVYKYNDIGEELEIIVVDNNSADYETMHSKLQKLYPNVIVIKNEKNGGYGQGNNIGIRASSAPIIAVMNPDVRLIMPVFGTFIKALSSPNVVMCGGKQWLPSNKPYVSFQYQFNISPFLRTFIFPLCIHIDYYDYRRMWLQGAFFAIKKKEFIDIGLFDENIFLYEEECDIHIRLRAKVPHTRIVYLPKLKYIHFTENRPITQQLVEQQTQSQLYLCQKHNISTKQYIKLQYDNIRMQKLYCILRLRKYELSQYMKIRLHLLETIYLHE